MEDTTNTNAPSYSDIEIVDRYLRAIDPHTDIVELEDLRQLEELFIETAARFSQANGINRDAWLDVGVPPALLEQARIRN